MIVNVCVCVCVSVCLCVQAFDLALAKIQSSVKKSARF